MAFIDAEPTEPKPAEITQEVATAELIASWLNRPTAKPTRNTGSYTTRRDVTLDPFQALLRNRAAASLPGGRFGALADAAKHPARHVEVGRH